MTSYVFIGQLKTLCACTGRYSEDVSGFCYSAA